MRIRVQQWIFGGSVFLISLAAYLLTLEPTASFWDCSEFIACAYKLEVGHAPGAPVYLLLGRMFALLAGGNTQHVAAAVNALSAVASALTVMLLFHIIYWFAKKLIRSLDAGFVGKTHFIAVVAALTGSLSYAFTDSFWFSAVEAEVYATSSLFSALVVWCIIKYEQELPGWPENRWLVLIFFLLGLSVGIHLLNLLALPAMALVVYFKHYKTNWKKTLLTTIISLSLIIMFIYGIIPGVAKAAAYSDLMFVNRFGLPVYSGAIFFVLLLSSVLMLLFRYLKTRRYVLRFMVLLTGFWLIGYSSFAVLVIRSADDPFVDINNVENMFGLVDYLNREQYPQRPLFFGNHYNTPVTGSEKRFTYKLYNGRYIQDELYPAYEYDRETLGLFPRMASTEPRHAGAYGRWVDIRGRKVKIIQPDGSSQTLVVPTLADNIRFFIKYQVGHMYLRYFMWNFAGRQNDIQGHGDRYSGNWMSGIAFLDSLRLGDQDDLPDFLKNHKARNTYYLIPLLLGIFGFIFHARHDVKNFGVALALFFFTGPAIVLYLNEVPVTPRERDYVHVGSFMVFALWIGLGAAALVHGWMKYVKSGPGLRMMAALPVLLVPGILLSENWDDHNRSGRYAARDFAKNMLSSCAQNAILFTTADNDTYPVWYLQQVENFRPDVRQVLAPFLGMDWYGNQMNTNFEGCGSVPVSFRDDELLMKTNQYFPVIPRIDSAIDVKELIGFIKSSDTRTMVRAGDGEVLKFVPGNNLSLTVNAGNFAQRSEHLVIGRNRLPEQINFTLQKNYLTRDELLILDILTNNDWKRPVYTIYPSLFHDIGLAPYLHREGMVYRLLPYRNNEVLHNRKAFAEHQFNLISDEFIWGNVNDPDVFVDHTIRQNAETFRFRQMFSEVAGELIAVGENEKAAALIDMARQVFPAEIFPYDVFSPDLAQCYYRMGKMEQGDLLAGKMARSAGVYLDYYLPDQHNQPHDLDAQAHMQVFIMQELIRICNEYNRSMGERLLSGPGSRFRFY